VRLARACWPHAAAVLSGLLLALPPCVFIDSAAIRIQTTGWNNRYKFRLPHGHTWTKWQGTNKTMEMALSIRAVSLRAQAGYSAITRMTWKSTQRCRDNWIDPIDDDAAFARLIYTWSDHC
jgi:hypothetical protein